MDFISQEERHQLINVQFYFRNIENSPCYCSLALWKYKLALRDGFCFSFIDPEKDFGTHNKNHNKVVSIWIKRISTLLAN